MVKHNETIRQQKPTNCLSVSEHFVELVLKGVTLYFIRCLCTLDLREGKNDPPG